MSCAGTNDTTSKVKYDSLTTPEKQREALFSAIRENDVDSVEKLLNKFPNIKQDKFVSSGREQRVISNAIHSALTRARPSLEIVKSLTFNTNLSQHELDGFLGIHIVLKFDYLNGVRERLFINEAYSSSGDFFDAAQRRLIEPDFEIENHLSIVSHFVSMGADLHVSNSKTGANYVSAVYAKYQDEALKQGTIDFLIRKGVDSQPLVNLLKGRISSRQNQIDLIESYL